MIAFPGARVVTSLPSELTPEVRQGLSLAGDDYSGEQLVAWFEQEKEAFFHDNDGNSEIDSWYAHMRYVNERLGFSELRSSATSFSVLVLGPGSGIEVENIAARNPHWLFSFVEASENFRQHLKVKHPGSRIVAAQVSGDIDLASDTEDAACAFSVLHHIPNVSHVVREVFRVLKAGGIFLVREPCSSMGDWRFPRSATPNERGISRNLLISIARKAGFELVGGRPTPVLLSPLNGIFKRLHLQGFMGGAPFYWLDRLSSQLVALNDHYWRDTWWKRIGPSAYFYVFKKP